jgi:hypothetical protein
LIQSKYTKDSFTHPLGLISVPLGSFTFPLGSTSVPMGSSTHPLGSISVPIGSFTHPLGSNSVPIGSFFHPLGSTSVPIGRTNEPLGLFDESYLSIFFSAIKRTMIYVRHIILAIGVPKITSSFICGCYEICVLKSVPFGSPVLDTVSQVGHFFPEPYL